jgi:hypothetical protein
MKVVGLWLRDSTILTTITGGFLAVPSISASSPPMLHTSILLLKQIAG